MRISDWKFITAILIAMVVAPAFASAATRSTRMALLPAHFGIGVFNAQWEINSMTNAPWEYRYQYLNPGWDNYISNQTNGTFVKNYAQQSNQSGYIPEFTFYVYGNQDNPCNKTGIQTSSSKMYAYYANFALAMQNAYQSGVSRIIFSMEPDTWGFMQQCYGDNPSVIPWSVASSGYPGLASLPNNASGFAQALVAIRDAIAPNVILALHVSMWGANYYPTNGADPVAAGNRVVTFYNNLHAPFDMLFYETDDSDAAYRVIMRGQSPSSAWWSDYSYTSYLTFINTIYNATGLNSMLWQMPIGNTLYDTCNNTNYHFQDNKLEYFLQSGNRQHIVNFVNAGVIGSLFSAGQNADTNYMDYAGDGITNPAPIHGNPFGTLNSLTSYYSDDDGGFLRLSTAAYYAAGSVSTGPAGPLTFKSAAGAALPTNIAPGQPIALSASFQASAAAANVNVALAIQLQSVPTSYNAQNNYVAQTFAANETKNYTWSLTIPSTLAAGTYCLVGGVADTTWSTWYTWNSCAATFTVVAK
jgi:hypothetical protein